MENFVLEGDIFYEEKKKAVSFCCSGGPSVISGQCRHTLYRMGGVAACWWAFPLAEILGCTYLVIMLRHLYRTDIKPLDDPLPEEGEEVIGA